MRRDPLSTAVFIFWNRRRNQLKLLHWDGDGFALYHKRLEKGTFELPEVGEGQLVVCMEADQLKKMIFGARQERFVPDQSIDPAQISMGLSAEPVIATSLIRTQKIEYKRNVSIPTTPATTHQGRMKLPDHLERKEILVDVEGAEGRRRIGEEVTEELEYEPGRLYVNRYIRPKYVSADNQTILIAPLPERPLPKAIAGPGLLTQILIDKYVDHLPLHRQQQRFNREVSIRFGACLWSATATIALLIEKVKA